LYKDLQRTFSRVNIPSELEMQFSFLGDYYNLAFPQVREPDFIGEPRLFQPDDCRDLSGLIDQMAAWIKGFASKYRMVFFKGDKLASTEEQAIAETGKILFLPFMQSGFPATDPFPSKQLITRDIFYGCLEHIGAETDSFDSVEANFIKSKIHGGLISDAWFPITFHEYVVGYVRIWIDEPERKPFGYEIIEDMHQFTKLLSYSLEINSYFAKGKVTNSPFEGSVIDVSASGVLFSYPTSAFSTYLQPNSKLAVTIVAPDRSISMQAVIIRTFKDESNTYFGCRFEGISAKDLHDLFESIYGKPFANTGLRFLAGKV
jgi:hypothetical protein